MYYFFVLVVNAFSCLAVNIERMKTLMRKISAGESMSVYNSMSSIFIEADTPISPDGMCYNVRIKCRYCVITYLLNNLYQISCSQEKQKEMLNADWKGLQFNGIKALTRESSIFMCTIANDDNDSCKYTICQECEVEHKPRGRLCVACRDECRKECHH